MHRPLALAVAGLTLAGTAGVLATDTLAQASSDRSVAAAVHPAAKSPNEHFVLEEINGKQYVVLHGLVNAYGKNTSPKDNYDVSHLKGGTLRITHPDKDSTFGDHVNPKTCFASFTIKGTLTIGHGTGKYRGVKGTGSYSGHGEGFLKRTKSGACNTKADSKGEVDRISGSATLSK